MSASARSEGARPAGRRGEKVGGRNGTDQQRATPRRPVLERRSERGQATAEYALVILAAAALAGLLLAWAAGTDGIERLLDAVLDTLIEQAG